MIIWDAIKSFIGWPEKPESAKRSTQRQYRIVKYINANGKEIWHVQEDWFGTWQFVMEDTWGGRKGIAYYSLNEAQQKMERLTHLERESDITFVGVELTTTTQPEGAK